MSSPWLRMRFSEAVEVNPRRTVQRGTITPFVDMATLSTEAPHVRPSRSKSAGAGGSRFRNGDTLFARITPCTENGKTGLVDGLATGEVGTGSTEFIVLGPRRRLTLARFVYYLAKNPAFRSFAISQMRGTSGRQRVPASVFDDYVVGVPSLPEQRKIAAILSSIDDAIEKTRAVIDQVQVVKRGLMQELFTRGLPGKHGRPKPLLDWRLGRVAPNLTQIPESWDLVPILSVAKLESGHTPSRRKPEYWNGSVPWISLHDTASLDGPEIVNTKQSISELGLRNSSARLLPRGTVVFSRTATVGKSTIMAREMSTTQDFANYICGPRLHNRYLMHLFRHMQPEWKRLMAGSTHKTVYMPIFRQLQILLPPVVEQEEIANVLGCLDDRIAAETEEEAQLRNLKSALMSVLLTGELRVTPDPEPE